MKIVNRLLEFLRPERETPAPRLESSQSGTRHVFCTYCSFSKSRERGLLPPIQRYQSTRIRKVYRSAQEVGVGFLILSGEFGLVGPDEPQIPYYDHLLKPEEVGQMATRVARQLLGFGVEKLVYFTRPLKGQDNLWPYHDVIASACSRASVAFAVIELA